MVTARPGSVHRTEISYAADIPSHLVGRPARRLTRVDANVIEDVRLYYDGPEYVGLPLGKVGAGNVTRQETLVLRADQAAAAYDDWPGGRPVLKALGYRYAGYGTRKLPFLRPPAIGPIRYRSAPEGFGYFIDQTRFRYVRPDGRLVYGLVASQLDPAGTEWTYVYDAFWLHAVSHCNPDGETVTAAPDYRASRLASVIDANGRTQSNVYDAFGRLSYTVNRHEGLGRRARPSLV
jgi:YD repeat-containing protein